MDAIISKGLNPLQFLLQFFFYSHKNMKRLNFFVNSSEAKKKIVIKIKGKVNGDANRENKTQKRYSYKEEKKREM